MGIVEERVKGCESRIGEYIIECWAIWMVEACVYDDGESCCQEDSGGEDEERREPMLIIIISSLGVNEPSYLRKKWGTR